MLTVYKVGRVVEKDSFLLRAQVHCEEAGIGNQEIWVRYPLEFYDASSQVGNPFLAALVMPAMKLGVPLCIDSPVSAQLVQNMHTFMEVAHAWFPGYTPVPVHAETTAGVSVKPNAVGCFFSAGVDSFYTVLKHHIGDEGSGARPVTQLIFNRGQDIPLANTAFATQVSTAIAEIATELHKQLILTSTNLRDFYDQLGIRWIWVHGCFLAALALGLEPLFQVVYIPATQAYEDLFAWGSHPLTDTLFSTESLRFVHDGAEFHRLEKVDYISKHDVALRYLRVCYKDVPKKYNCGRCWKCLLTMVDLALAGALDKCTIFDAPLTPEAIRTVWIRGETRADWQHALDELDLRKCNPQLRDAVAYILSPRRPYLAVERTFGRRAKRVIAWLDRRLLRGRVAQALELGARVGDEGA